MTAGSAYLSDFVESLHFHLQQAAEAGIQMEQRSVSHQELKGLLLGGKHVVIALVDKDLHNLAVPLWFSPGAQTQEIGFKGRLYC